ncbi:MAG: substrate-binding domain-containing protein [Sulfurovaceae bacterium]|nr:substrate-binding domain-containing protein [Sulfurovaceae bacterium]
MFKTIITVGILTISLYSETQENRPLQLNMYACGITRVAFIKELTNSFEQERNISISLNKKGGVGFVTKGLHDKKIEIGAGCRVPLKNDIEKDIWGTQVAWGALAFIVNENNKIDNLSLDNIKKILLGKITNWKEVGGENKPITLYLRKGKKSGVGSTARKLIFNDASISFSKNAIRVKSSGPIRKGVISNKYAFAIDDVTSSSRTKGIKIISVDSISPTKENISHNKYTLRRPFFIYLGKQPTKWARQFLSFALTEKGQKIISQTGTANLEEALGKNDDKNLIFQKMMFQIKSK